MIYHQYTTTHNRSLVYIVPVFYHTFLLLPQYVILMLVLDWCQFCLAFVTQAGHFLKGLVWHFCRSFLHILFSNVLHSGLFSSTILLFHLISWWTRSSWVSNIFNDTSELYHLPWITTTLESRPTRYILICSNKTILFVLTFWPLNYTLLRKYKH